MKKLFYSMLVIVSCALVQSASGLVIPPQDAQGSDANKPKYPEIAACAHKKEGDACMLQPNPMAMVVMSGSCKVGPADIGGVKASVLKCEPKRIPLGSKPGALDDRAPQGTTVTAPVATTPAVSTTTDATAATDTSVAASAPASSVSTSTATDSAQGAQTGGIISKIKSGAKNIATKIANVLKPDPALAACKGKNANDACTLQPNKMAMVMMQGTCQPALTGMIGDKKINKLKCQPTPVAPADSSTTGATSSQADVAGAAAADSAGSTTSAPALLSESTPAGAPAGLPQEPGIQIPGGNIPAGA